MKLFYGSKLNVQNIAEEEFYIYKKHDAKEKGSRTQLKNVKQCSNVSLLLKKVTSIQSLVMNSLVCFDMLHVVLIFLTHLEKDKIIFL